MVIGVTGGVGAGKSTILAILEEEFHAKLIRADDVAKELTEPGGASYAAVKEAFGDGILVPESRCSGQEEAASGSEGRRSAFKAEKGAASRNRQRPIDRAKLAALVFQEKEKLALLNSLVHPKVKEEILARIAAFYQADADALIVVEAALLIEAGYREILDSLWVVTADRKIRIARLKSSRGYLREKSLSMMEHQLSDADFRAHGDVVIDNSGTLEEAKAQVRAAMRRMRREGI